MIYIKTDKGRDEIATRQRRLTSKLRALLILIDGKKNVQDLVKLHQGSMDVPMLLRQLLDRGYIKALPEADDGAELPVAREPDPKTAPIAKIAAEEPAPASEPVVDQGHDLDAARALAVRLLREAMGSDAHSFAGRLERCASGEDLLAHAERYAIVIGSVRSKALGDTYLKQVRAALAR